MSYKPSLKVQEFIANDWLGLEDTEWQNRLYFFGGYLLLQRQTKVKVDLFELMCEVLNENLPAHVHWMRHNCNYMKLKFHDQHDQIMLLKDSWSVILILDQMHQRIHNNMPDEIELPNGQKFDLLNLLGAPSMAEKFLEVSENLKQLCFDSTDFLCLKFLLLLNAGAVQHNKQEVHEASEKVHEILLEYCQTCYPNIPEKYNQLLAQIPELRSMAHQGEDFLYLKHMEGNAPHHGTLLMEMLFRSEMTRYEVVRRRTKQHLTTPYNYIQCHAISNPCNTMQ